MACSFSPRVWLNSSFFAENRVGGRAADRWRDWGSFTSSWAAYSLDTSPDPRRAVQNSRGVGGKGQPLWEKGRWFVCAGVLVWRGKKISTLECACSSLPVCARHHQQALMRFTVIEKFLISLPSNIIVHESSPLWAQCMINCAQLTATLITPTVYFSRINFHQKYMDRIFSGGWIIFIDICHFYFHVIDIHILI